jgi:hypothetical protein
MNDKPREFVSDAAPFQAQADKPEPTHEYQIRKSVTFTEAGTGKTVAEMNRVKFHRPDTWDLLTAHRLRLERLPPAVRMALDTKWDVDSGLQLAIRGIHTPGNPREAPYFGPETVASEDQLIEIIRAQLADIEDELIKLQYVHNPAHIVALEQQLLALRVNSSVLWDRPHDNHGALQRATVDTLKAATTYNWSPACVEAVAAKADLLPVEAMPAEMPLGEVTEPAASGWWWFEHPIPAQTTTTREPVVALLWRRELRDGLVGDALGSGERVSGTLSLTWFNLFILESVEFHGRKMLVPSPILAWVWADGATIEQLATTLRVRFDHLRDTGRLGQASTTTEIAAEAALWFSKFWMAGGTWLDSRVTASGKRRPSTLAKVTTALPRQQARALARQHGLGALPTVEVVYLRRAALQDHEASTEARPTKDHDFCWFVPEFPRRQWFPSLGRHQLIMVSEHIRGPKDKPLKHARKIYAVNR